MTRECTQDFLLLKKYITDYSINRNLEEDSYLAVAKRIHKAYFSLVNWHAEYQYQQSFFSENCCDNDKVIVRLSEVFSDIGSSKFNWLNGSYKASRVMLRSAIENFVRSISAIGDRELLKETSVYSLFEKAGKSEIFTSSENINNSYKNLHSKYKELCRDTHTSSSENMENITSLIDYPKYDEEKSKSTGALFVSTAKSILVILCLIFNELFHNMHYKNKENILEAIPRSIRPLVLVP